MFLQCQVSMSTTVPAPAPVGHGSLTVTRPRGTCLGLATRVWDTLHVRGGRGVTGLDWVLLCSVVFRADSSVAAPHQCGWHAASAASAQLAGPTSNIWRAPAFIPSLPGLRIRWTSVHQPRYLDVAVASPCLFIFIQLA